MRRRSVCAAALFLPFLSLAALELWSGPGYTASFLALLCAATLGIGAAVAADARKPAALKWFLRYTAAFGAVVPLLILDARLNLWWAERNANAIVDACRAYESEWGTLPSSLALLVPDNLPKVPRAKLLGGGTRGDYEYCVGDNDHRLSYVSFMPFFDGIHRLSLIYRFESRAWTVSESYADTRGPGAVCRWPAEARSGP